MSRTGAAHLCPHRIDNVRACQVTNLDWISNTDVKSRLGSLLHADAGPLAALVAAGKCSVHGRWHAGPSRPGVHVIVVVVDAVRVGRASRLGLLRRHRRAHHQLLLLRRGRRSRLGGTGIVVVGSAQRAEGIFNGLEARGLGDETARTARGAGCRGRGCAAGLRRVRRGTCGWRGVALRGGLVRVGPWGLLDVHDEIGAAATDWFAAGLCVVG